MNNTKGTIPFFKMVRDWLMKLMKFNRKDHPRFGRKSTKELQHTICQQRAMLMRVRIGAWSWKSRQGQLIVDTDRTWLGDTSATTSCFHVPMMDPQRDELASATQVVCLVVSGAEAAYNKAPVCFNKWKMQPQKFKWLNFSSCSRYNSCVTFVV